MAKKKVATKKKAVAPKKAAVKKAAIKKVAPKKKAAKKATVSKKATTPKKSSAPKKVAKKATAPKKVIAPKKATKKAATPKKAAASKKATTPKKVAAPTKAAPVKKIVKKAVKKAQEKTVSRRAIVVEQKEKVKKPPTSIRETSKKYIPAAPTNIRTIKNIDGKILGHRATHELNAANSKKKKAVTTNKKRKSILGAGSDDGAFMRYNDSDLDNFGKAIREKLEKARTELKYLQGLITRKDDSGTDDTENRYASMEDGSVANQREQLNQMAGRQINFINNLEKAIIRIKNKTYGICRETGTLISKNRLLAVPHATLSKAAKDARR